MDKDNAPASQQIKQHYNQTQQAEKFTTKHTYFRRLTDEFFFGGFSANRIFFCGFMATLQNSASRLKFGDLGSTAIVLRATPLRYLVRSA